MPLADLPGGVITMHAVVQPPIARKKMDVFFFFFFLLLKIGSSYLPTFFRKLTGIARKKRCLI